MEENKNPKPFDLEKAKAGAKVVTRDGRNVRIICWDRKHSIYPIIALEEFHRDDGKTEERINTYTDRGEYRCGEESDIDLFIAPTEVERWVNVYKDENGGYYNGCLCDSEEMALQNKDDKYYVTTTKISWEE